ncbi:MAG: hypothetical protein SAJ12_10710 [Jaaginema sp. PMC 1079.18]|nr:hypothetical protein [Jaaginema sp. PMC 1080.18]MEC4851473.1 hypothetical protein [Jaaginema sp. PMC 1079.18]MEC4867824.1 hypothetical protein [Jaaginema sp. PMC 1078.18]
MKRIQQCCLKIALVGLGTATVFLPQTSAQAISLDNPLDSLISQLNEQLQAIQSTFEGEINDRLASITEGLSQDVDAAVGSLGLPDILATRSQIEGAQNPETGGTYQETAIANEIDRLVTRMNAASSLSSEGQQQQLKALAQTEQTVGLVQQEATAAQGEVVTQNVMKRIARQNQLTSSVLGDLRAGQIQANQGQALANTNLSNISENLDGQQQRQSGENLGAAFDVLRSASFVGLY